MRTRGLEAAVIRKVDGIAGSFGWLGVKEKSRQSFRCGGFEFQRRTEIYGAPLAGLTGIMDGMDIAQQARRCRGRLPCFVAGRSWREDVIGDLFYT
jgi:hypothetical protein